MKALSTPKAKSDWPLCPKCGHPNEPSEWMCRKCGHTLGWPPEPATDSWTRTPTTPAGPSGWQGGARVPAPGTDPYSVVVRRYQGSQGETANAMQYDAQQMAAAGYRIVAQSYAPGQWGAIAFLVALVLCLFLIGFLIFVYLLIVKPAGTLTVTYQR